MTSNPIAPSLTDADVKEILSEVTPWLNKEFINTHKKNSKSMGKLDNININPFLLRYLAKLAYGAANPNTMAKVIVFTRALGSSPSTTFGNAMRKFCVEFLQGRVQKYSGSQADVKFYDYIDQRTCWARLRLGPDNLNMRTAKNFLSDFKDLEKQDSTAADSCVIGVLYGDINSVNSSFKWIQDQDVRVFVGADFWHRITGHKDFYTKLVHEIESSLDKTSDSYLDDVVNELSQNLSKYKLDRS